MLCPGAKSATVAPCSANGAHMRVGVSFARSEKQRNRIVAIQDDTVGRGPFGLAQLRILRAVAKTISKSMKIRSDRVACQGSGKYRP